MSTISEITPNGLVAMRGGQVGRYHGRCQLTGRHRVSIYKNLHNGLFVHPKHADPKQTQFTVWLLGDDGLCRGDKAESINDFVGEAA